MNINIPLMPRPFSQFLMLNLLCVALFFGMNPAFAIEAAPPITDREIFQELIMIKADIKAGQEKTNQRFEDMNKRFEDINKRFEDFNQRFEDTNKRFDDVNKRFDIVNHRIDDLSLSINKRLDDMNLSINHRISDLSRTINDLYHTVITLFASLLGLMTALIGFVIWDRRTMMKPLEERIERLEQNTKTIKTNQELLSDDSNLLKRIHAALCEMTKNNQEMAAVMRSFSLL